MVRLEHKALDKRRSEAQKRAGVRAYPTDDGMGRLVGDRPIGVLRSQVMRDLFELLPDGRLVVRTPSGVVRETWPPGGCYDPEPEPPWIDEQAPPDPAAVRPSSFH